MSLLESILIVTALLAGLVITLRIIVNVIEVAGNSLAICIVKNTGENETGYKCSRCGYIGKGYRNVVT